MPRFLPAPAFSSCRRLTAAVIPVSLGLPGCAGEQAPSGPPTTGPELLEAGIRYHDPDDRWPRLRHTLVIDQSPPDGSERRAAISLDAGSSDYSYEEDTADGRLVKGTDGDECFATVEGDPPTDDQTARLRLHHDEAAGDGEYILLEGEREVLGMRIPAERRWFTNAQDRYLGTDVLVDDYPGGPAR